MIHSTSPQGVAATSSAMHASYDTSGAMHACHVTNPGEASPDELERDTWTSHGSMGPPERINHLKSTCTPGIDLRAHMTATPGKHTLMGPTWGRPTLESVKPTLAQLIQGLHVALVH
jgi:hypothetical protein